MQLWQGHLAGFKVVRIEAEANKTRTGSVESEGEGMVVLG